MREVTSSTQSTKRRVIFVSIGVALMAAIVVWVSFGRPDLDSSSPPVRPDASSPPSSDAADETLVPPATSEDLSQDDASQTVSLLVASIATIASDPSRDASTLGNIASGPVLDEINADSDELTSNGWTRVGSPTVSGAEVISTNGTSAVVQACIDSTNVQLLDSSGIAIPKDDSTSRSLNLFSLTFESGAWRVTARTFPDNPAC